MSRELWAVELRKVIGLEPEKREQRMTGAERIAAERKRQIEVEGWTPEHDAAHSTGELVRAAENYLAAARRSETAAIWPWNPEWWKPSADPIRNLEKAGALVAAEIDRLIGLEPEEEV